MGNNIIIFFNPRYYAKENDFYHLDCSEIEFFDEFNSLIIISDKLMDVLH